MESLEQLIGGHDPDNLHRLKMVALKQMQGILPINRSFLSEETVQHLGMLEQHINGRSAEDFYVLREHYIAFVMSFQRDEGFRSANALQVSS